MRTLLIVFSAAMLSVCLGACDGGDGGKNIPRTVPPVMRGSAVALPEVVPPVEIDKKPIHGKGPKYWV